MSVSIGGKPTTSSRHKTREEAEGMVRCWKTYFEKSEANPEWIEYSIQELDSEIGAVELKPD